MIELFNRVSNRVGERVNIQASQIGILAVYG